jgi:hypothetical protein
MPQSAQPPAQPPMPQPAQPPASPWSTPPYAPQPGGYAQGWNGTPTPGPGPLPVLAPLEPEEPEGFRVGLRFNPLDLLFRRVTFQGEVAIWGPFSAEIAPSWIFGSPTENLDTTGFALQASLSGYISGQALDGFFIRGIAGFETFTATLTDPGLNVSATKEVGSPIFGIGLGSSSLFGDGVAFNLSGGLGVGFATGDAVTITAGRYETVFYDKTSAIQLLSSLSLGVAF